MRSLNSITALKLRSALRCGPLAAILMAGCSVGPNFTKPAPPAVNTYLPVPLTATSGATNLPGGEPQRFVPGGDIPGDWWTLFHSKPLNDL
ncbi:MAG: histidine kinase, partial [Limisphaerales bacterium]